MQIYQTVIHDAYNIGNNSTISLIEDEGVAKLNLPFRIEFYNNQNREIELRSEFAIDKLGTEQKWMFVVHDVVSFSWSTSENIIKYSLGKFGTQILLEYWLSHNVFPIYLMFKEKYYFLHVGAVTLNTTPIAFMAKSYGGKSTLTDFFMKKGHPLVTDDKLATYEKGNEIFAIPSFPYHRPYREQETLGDFVENFEKKVRAIKSIYLLEQVASDDSIVIEELKGIEKFKQLRYGSEIEFPFMFEERSHYLVKLAKLVNVYKISIPWDLNRLEEVYSSIIEHQKKLKLEN